MATLGQQQRTGSPLIILKCLLNVHWGIHDPPSESFAL